MNEEWKDIPGYEGLYQASNTGYIRSVEGKTTSNSRYAVRKWSSRILKPKKRMRTNGMYDHRVELWKDGTHKSLLVARLVAMTWCEGYKEGLTVNHIDGNPLNNVVANLEWVTRSENIQKGYETGLYDNARKKCVLKDKEDSSMHVFNSQYEASKFLCHGKKYVNNRIIKNKTSVFSKDGGEYEIVQF